MQSSPSRIGEICHYRLSGDEETVKLDQEQTPGGDGKGSASYGALAASASEPGFGDGSGSPRPGSGIYIKRRSVTSTTGSAFERPLSSVPSLKSLQSGASIRTRITSVSRQEYHDDLKVSLKSGLTPNLVLATFIIVFGCSFLFGWNIGVLNQPVDLIKEFYNETYRERYGSMSEDGLTVVWSLTTALFVPGGMAGAFLGGAIADKLGRKRSILIAHIFAFIGGAVSCVCVAAKAPELLMIGRLFFGINSGLGNCLAPIFLSEISPFNLRGALGTVHQLAVTLGIFFSSVFGLKQILGTPSGWPFLMLLEVIPAAVSLIVLPFLPETPRYLLLVKGEREAAEKSLQFYRAQEDVTVDMEEMDTEQSQTESDKGEVEPVKMMSFLTDRQLRAPLFVACTLQVIQQFSGINAIFFYSNGIFKNAKVPDAQIPYAVIGTNAVNVIMTIVSVPLMDIAGRRILLLIPMIGMIVDLALITVSLNLQNQVFWMNYVSVAAVIIYVIGFAVGLGPIPMMIGAELFRQGPRPVAMAVAGVTNWVFTFIVAMSFESIQLELQNWTFLLFFFMMIGFTIFIFFMVPETKGKTFEEIAHEWQPGTAIEVEEVIDDVFDDVEPAPEPNDVADGEESKLVKFRLGSVDAGDEDPSVHMGIRDGPPSPAIMEEGEKGEKIPLTSLASKEGENGTVVNSNDEAATEKDANADETSKLVDKKDS